MEFIKKNKTIIFILIMILLHVFLGTTLNLTDDEAYYWTWSQHLDISYYDHPPMVAYFIKFFTMIFGNTNLAVRLPAISTIAIVSILIDRIIRYLYKDKQKAFIGVVIFNFIPIFSMASIMTLPDIPLILFYSLTLYFFIRLIYEKKAQLWYLIGGLVGLGLLSKYNMFMVYPAVFAYLIIDKKERFWLKRKEPYLAFIFSLLFFIPVIIWNINHNWLSFSFHLYQRHSKELTFKFDILLQFIIVQMLVVSPVLFYGYFKVIFKNFHKKDVKLLSLYGTPVFLIFLFSSLFTEFKIHWAAMAYIPWTILLSNYINWNRFWKYIGIGLAVFLSLFIFTQSYYPIAAIPPKDDITTDMHGWDQVGKKVQSYYNDLEQDDWFLFSNRYQLSSQLAFYLPDKDYVYSLNNKTEQFDFWKDEKELIGKNGVFVTHSFYKKDPNELYDFEKIKLIEKIDIIRAEKVYRQFYIYKGYNYQGLK